ncbi:MAG TPA: DMT family transporter [Candidatus Handelsmanbacteria bacterium]|nr:DMT family transporter [Candidatus Handelsmanbacteria bacterium]
MGALILFGAVQATMIGSGLWSGERLHVMQWVGLVAALGGLAWLVRPGISAPDPIGALLMGISGIAWGYYSIRGRGASTPIASTAGNFARTVPMAAVAFTLFAVLSSFDAQPAGLLLAVVSGGITSGLGYVLWYRALRSLTTTEAQLLHYEQMHTSGQPDHADPDCRVTRHGQKPAVADPVQDLLAQITPHWGNRHQHRHQPETEGASLLSCCQDRGEIDDLHGMTQRLCQRFRRNDLIAIQSICKEKHVESGP